MRAELQYNPAHRQKDREADMGRNPTTRSAQILYIGREDVGYEKVWQAFAQDGVNVAFARTQTLGLQMARQMQPTIVVVNAANSHFSGERLCKTLGRRLPQARRLVIAEQGEGRQIECEERLVRPFTGRKLRETLRKLVDAASPHILRAGGVELDMIARVVHSAHGKAHLTPKQCRLLAIFMERPNQVVSREDLMKDIWETHYLGDTRTLDVHMRWLREKIEQDPTHPTFLVTVRGVGYKLVVAQDRPKPSTSENGGEPR